MSKSLRVDHVNDYKPPKDNDKYDDETRQLHEEGCAPKVQLPPEQIKRESECGEIVGGIRLPMRLPIETSKNSREIVKKVIFVMKLEFRITSMFYVLIFEFAFRSISESGEKREKREKG